MSDPACRTVLDVRNGKRAAAVVRQVFNWQGDFWGGGSTLASYRDGEARRAFDRLQRALGACRSYEDTGWEGRFTATLTAEPTPDIGDEAVRFRETVSPGSGELGVRDQQFTVVRAGNTIATFHKLSVGGSVSFPADLVNRQVRRLQDAQRP
ncbi:hypothetical protein ACFWNK_00385 [Streptomyces sp. NPDC058417]|uniref:hypothetical protein n=1 Tax=unclassified Streptomyces TaxID=2593676 RepID=UPI003647C29C